MIKLSPKDYEKIVNKFPIFQQACPRKYVGVPNDYAGAFDLGLGLTELAVSSNLALQDLNNRNTVVTSGKEDSILAMTIYAGTVKTFNAGVPTYWVSEELAKALSLTQFPETLQLQELKFPLDSFVMMLPKSIYKPGWILFSIIRPGDGPFKAKGMASKDGVDIPFAEISIPDNTVRNGIGAMLIATCQFLQDNGCITAGYIPLNRTLSEHFSRVRYGELGDYGEDPKITASLVLNLITLMSTLKDEGKEFVEYGRELRKPTIGPKPKSALWSPNWIGKNYKLGGASGGKDHRSPRAHWRRGHWRIQPYGKGNSLTKVLWIHPCLVSTDEVAT